MRTYMVITLIVLTGLCSKALTSDANNVDLASKVINQIENIDPPTWKDIYGSVKYIRDIKGYSSISDQFLRTELIRKTSGNFVYTAVVDTYIDFIVEAIEKNGWFDKECPFGAFCDKYVFKSLLLTAKNSVGMRWGIPDLAGQFADQVFVIAESWVETREALGIMPCFDSLPTDQQKELRNLYLLKQILRSPEPSDCTTYFSGVRPAGGGSWGPSNDTYSTFDLAKIKTALPYAELSQRVYLSNCSCIDLDRVGDWSSENKIDTEFTDYGPFYASIFRHDSSGHEEIALVFRGTDENLDWWTNLHIDIPDGNAPEQYQMAADLVQKVVNTYPRAKVTLAGHSLGGGLAQYGAWKYFESTGRRLDTFVFNSAGLWLSTKDTKCSEIKNLSVLGFTGRNSRGANTDYVEKFGCQGYGEPVQLQFDVVINFVNNLNPGTYLGTGPIVAVDPLRQEGAQLHNMCNMLVEMRDALEQSDVDPTFETNHKFSTALIIDKSGSMGETVIRSDKTSVQRLEVAKQALRAYVRSLDDTDTISISSFSNSADTQLPIEEGLVDQIKGKLDTYLNQIKLAGQTNIGAGLCEGFKQLNNSSAKGRTALLLSDGENNTGEFQTALSQYVAKGWPVCTIGFGTQAGEKQLEYIANITGGTYYYADAGNLINTYQQFSSYAQNRESTLQTSDLLDLNGRISYPFDIYANAESLRVYSSWGGSTLRVKITDPSGRNYGGSSVGTSTRLEKGATFQMLEIKQPEPGQWTLNADWAIPPKNPELVNITVSEKTDVFVRAHGLRPHYAIGEAVQFKVDAMEVINSKKQPLLNATVQITVQKPEEQLVRMIQAQSSNWTMFKDVVVDVSRDIAMFDDGVHDERAAGDGIFAGTFTETDKNGPFIYSVKIAGQHRDGRPVERTITGSFQVGSILQNPVSASEVMIYQQKATNRNDSLDPDSDDDLDLLERIKEMEGDGLDSFENLPR
ncbi:VWA domain-containing protein [Pseudomonadota bacterium]